MILGALKELGLDIEWLSGQLQSLPLAGVSLEPQTVTRGALSGTLMKVCVPDPVRHSHQLHQNQQPQQSRQCQQSQQSQQHQECQQSQGALQHHLPHHSHHSQPPHHFHPPRRTLNDFVTLLQHSRLSEDIRSLAIRIFTAIAQAEAKVHGKRIEEIHFHELGYLDSVVDIVGALLGIKALGIEKIFSSPLHVGSGFTSTEHGTIPIPAPATLELLAGIPVYSTDISQELVTPTGAAIISTLASGFGPMPALCIQKTGYGAGTREVAQMPNFLRVIMGTLEPVETMLTLEPIEAMGTISTAMGTISTMDTMNTAGSMGNTEGMGSTEGMGNMAGMAPPFSDWRTERVSTMETDIDDMNPEYYDYLITRLLSAGALDVSLIPIVMKKNRPATRLSVLTTPSLIDELFSIIIQETSTLGIRIKDGWRKVVHREILTVQTPFGPIRVKIGKLNGKVVTASPEYEDCRQIALKTRRPLKEIYQEAIMLSRQNL